MKFIRLFEDFKYNNKEGTLLTIDDILMCIKTGGLVYSNIIEDYREYKSPNTGYTPVDIDKDGLVTVIIDNDEYTIKLKDIIKVDIR